MSAKYLVDNNVLTRLPADLRSTEFFRANCRIPAEVVYEAGRESAFDDLRALEIPVTIEVLRHLADVMYRLPPEEFNVVDLYRNQGNADPLIIATALALRSREDEGLFGDDWVIVSSDEAVLDLANSHGFDALRTENFARLINHWLTPGAARGLGSKSLDATYSRSRRAQRL